MKNWIFLIGSLNTSFQFLKQKKALKKIFVSGAERKKQENLGKNTKKGGKNA